MKLTRIAMLALMLGIPASSVGQDPAPVIGGPVLGLVFDSRAGALRPILGIPGAATLGEPLNLGAALAWAAVSSRQDYALAQFQGEPGVVIVDVSGASVSIRPLSGISPGISQAALSPVGGGAALYSKTTNRIQRVTGLPGSPSVRDEIDPGGGASAPSSMAISDDGAVLLVNASDGTGVAVIGPDGIPVRALGTASSFTFLHGSHDALLANRTDHTVYLVRDVTDRAESVLLAGEQDGVTAPVAVAVSRDNARAFIAGNSGAVAAVDLAGGVPRFSRCFCTPTGLQPMMGSSVFRLTEPSDAPMWLYEDGNPEARILFVPVSSRLQTSEGSQP